MSENAPSHDQHSKKGGLGSLLKETLLRYPGARKIHEKTLPAAEIFKPIRRDHHHSDISPDQLKPAVEPEIEARRSVAAMNAFWDDEYTPDGQDRNVTSSPPPDVATSATISVPKASAETLPALHSTPEKPPAAPKKTDFFVRVRGFFRGESSPTSPAPDTPHPSTIPTSSIPEEVPSSSVVSSTRPITEAELKPTSKEEARFSLLKKLTQQEKDSVPILSQLTLSELEAYVAMTPAERNTFIEKRNQKPTTETQTELTVPELLAQMKNMQDKMNEMENTIQRMAAVILEMKKEDSKKT